jgi:hypothetical protein
MTDIRAQAKADNEALQAMRARLELFTRSPQAQHIAPAELVAMRHQLRAVDEAAYWTRQLLRAMGLA